MNNAQWLISEGKLYSIHALNEMEFYYRIFRCNQENDKYFYKFICNDSENAFKHQSVLINTILITFNIFLIFLLLYNFTRYMFYLLFFFIIILSILSFYWLKNQFGINVFTNISVSNYFPFKYLPWACL